jgi:hypothetical protein
MVGREDKAVRIYTLEDQHLKVQIVGRILGRHLVLMKMLKLHSSVIS